LQRDLGIFLTSFVDAQNAYDKVNSLNQKTSFKTVVQDLAGEQLDKLWIRFPYQMRPVSEGVINYARKTRNYCMLFGKR